MKRKLIFIIVGACGIFSSCMHSENNLNKYRLWVHQVEGIPTKAPDLFPILGTNYFLVDITKPYSRENLFNSSIQIKRLGQQLSIDNKHYKIKSLSGKHVILLNLDNDREFEISNIEDSCHARFEDSGMIRFTLKEE